MFLVPTLINHVVYLFGSSDIVRKVFHVIFSQLAVRADEQHKDPQ